MTTATQYDQAYFVVQLKLAFTPEDVRAAYLRLSKAIHPDLHPELGQEPMKALNLAYEQVMKGWDNKSYQAAGYRDGEPVNDKTYTYEWDAGFERLAMEIIAFATTHPYTEDIELVGSWLWVGGGNKEGCPFRAPKKVKSSDGNWVIAEGEVDRRPYWVSLDGTETKVYFEWSKGNKKWYADLRKLVTRAHDHRVRSRVGLDKARGKYGSQKFDKREEASVARYA